MGLSSLALVAGALLVALLFAWWLYRAREVPVPGTAMLVGARATAIAVVLLLLLNPRIPGGATAGEGSSWTLVDQSTSMAAHLEDGATAWDKASSAVGSDAVVLFGNTPVSGAMATAQPVAGTSRLEGGLRLAIEAGARDVRVVSDFRISDLDSALELLTRAGVGADFEPVGGSIRNVGISDFEVGSGSSVYSADLELFGEAAGADSATIEVRVEGRSVVSQTVAVPAAGTRQRLNIPLPSAGADGRVLRYSAVVTLPGDGFADDNERIAYVRSGVDDGGVVLISNAPDWEPRFLLPTLRDVTGFAGEGYLGVSGGNFLRSFSDDGSVATVDSAAVRRRAFRAEVVVIHSSGPLDEWTRSWLPSLSRVILVAPDAEAAQLLGVTATAGRVGEWYVEDDAPVSLVSGGLTGVSFEGLPPLGPVLNVETAAGWSAVVRATYQRQGTPTPALLLGGGRRRVAVATAQGWWRWAFREGPARDAYRRVWSAVAGWMMEGQAQRVGEHAEPVNLVVQRGVRVEWAAPGLSGDTVQVRIGPSDAFVVDTTLVIDSTESFRTEALDPGTYAYAVVSTSDSTDGRFDVERFAPELTLAMADVEGAVSRTAPSLGMRVSGGRRLRTARLPYFLLIAVLSAEWLLRRRKGLR